MRVLMITLGCLLAVGCDAESIEPTRPSALKATRQPDVQPPQESEPPKVDAESGNSIANAEPASNSAEPQSEWEPEPYRHTTPLASEGDEPHFFTIAVGEKSRTRIAISPDRSSSRGGCYYQLQIEDYLSDTDSYFTQEALITTLSWTPIDYSPRSGEDFFVLSATPHGATLIERWQLNASEGKRVVARPVANTPIGVSLPEWQRQAEVLIQDVPLPDGEFDGDLRLERVKIETGHSGNLQRDLVADPDGRYLVVLDTQAFRRIDLRDNSSTTLVRLDELPAAAAKIDSLFFRHHADLGRLLFARTRGSEPELDFRLIFIDRDNDGVFEDRQQHDHASMMKLIGSPPAFVDDY